MSKDSDKEDYKPDEGHIDIRDYILSEAEEDNGKKSKKRKAANSEVSKGISHDRSK